MILDKERKKLNDSTWLFSETIVQERLQVPVRNCSTVTAARCRVAAEGDTEATEQ